MQLSQEPSSVSPTKQQHDCDRHKDCGDGVCQAVQHQWQRLCRHRVAHQQGNQQDVGAGQQGVDALRQPLLAVGAAAAQNLQAVCKERWRWGELAVAVPYNSLKLHGTGSRDSKHRQLPLPLPPPTALHLQSPPTAAHPGHLPTRPHLDIHLVKGHQPQGQSRHQPRHGHQEAGQQAVGEEELILGV